MSENVRSWVFALGLVGVMLFLMVSCFGWPGYAYPKYVHHYRLTLEVAVDGKIHSGSGVIESSGSPRADVLPEVGEGKIVLLGDAVSVDLGEGRNLFAILAHGARGTEGYLMPRMAIEAFEVPRCEGKYCQWRIIAGMSGKRELPLTFLPTLVTFRDIKDPSTAEVVYATEVDYKSRVSPKPRIVVVDRLDEVFGGKVKLHKAWIELTTDPVTRGIEKKLPWLITHRDELTKMRRKYKRFRYTPVYGHFKIGD